MTAPQHQRVASHRWVVGIVTGIVYDTRPLLGVNTSL